MPVPTDNTGSSVSAYMTESYEGLDRAFSEVSALPSRSYCDLYRAKRYGRWYLLKCLKQEHAADAVYQQLLRKEIEVLMRLQHPGVMQAVGMETVVLPGRGCVTCVVAEWIDGMTLAEHLKSNPPLKQLRRIALELAEALAYVHQQQVVHRDVKPSNVMITHNGGYVKLIDFGLAATTSIATTAVTACEQLTSVVVSPDNPVYDSRDSCNAIIETQTNMMVSGSAAATIPRSVTSLSDECFNFFNPKELTIPAQITRIGPWSLATYVERLYLESPVPPAFDSQGGQLHLIEPPNENDPYPDMVIYVPAGSAEAYRQAEGRSELADYIEEYQ